MDRADRNEFRVILDIPLDDKQRSTIEEAIKRAVLAELGKVDLGHAVNTSLKRWWPPILGLWFRDEK